MAACATLRHVTLLFAMFWLISVAFAQSSIPSVTSAAPTLSVTLGPPILATSVLNQVVTTRGAAQPTNVPVAAGSGGNPPQVLPSSGLTPPPRVIPAFAPGSAEGVTGSNSTTAASSGGSGSNGVSFYVIAAVVGGALVVLAAGSYVYNKLKERKNDNVVTFGDEPKHEKPSSVPPALEKNSFAQYNQPATSQPMYAEYSKSDYQPAYQEPGYQSRADPYYQQPRQMYQQAGPGMNTYQQPYYQQQRPLSPQVQRMPSDRQPPMRKPTQPHY
ncbi:hypothetical protein EDD86DRAFT_268164 [Gorgonomyces haynaldii]|nr:hypothetical protein EDD86DRAFT_268164 [Gorgonomyces haynaldii]